MIVMFALVVPSNSFSSAGLRSAVSRLGGDGGATTGSGALTVTAPLTSPSSAAGGGAFGFFAFLSPFDRTRTFTLVPVAVVAAAARGVEDCGGGCGGGCGCGGFGGGGRHLGGGWGASTAAGWGSRGFSARRRSF